MENKVEKLMQYEKILKELGIEIASMNRVYLNGKRFDIPNVDHSISMHNKLHPDNQFENVKVIDFAKERGLSIEQLKINGLDMDSFIIVPTK